MKLYGFWSSNPQKVRLALEELEVPYEYVNGDLRKREQRTPEFTALNPRQKVAVLVDGDAVLFDSGAALLWLAETSGKLLPTSRPQRARALSLLCIEGAAFQDSAGQYFYNRVVAPFYSMKETPEDLAAARPKMEKLLDVLEGQLTGDYLAGEFGIVDCAYAPWFPVLDIGERPKLQAWFERVKARPAWSRCAWTY